MTRASRLSVVVLAITAVVAMAGPAFATWLVTATNPTANAKATSLGPVTGLGTSVTNTSVTLSWTAPAGVPATAYTVTRTSPSTFTACDTTANTTCTDSGLTPGVTYAYSVVALRNNWTSSAVTTDATTTAGSPNFLVTFAAGPYTAGTATTVTLTAQNGSTTDTAYTGPHTIAWTGLANSPNASAPTYPTTAVTFANGVSTTTLNVTMRAAGSNTLTATESTRTGSATVSVSRANVALSLTCVASAPRNTGVTPTLGRPSTDAFGNAVTGTAVAVTVTATQATPASQTVTIASASTSQTFNLTLANNVSSTAVSTDAPTGYTATNCAINHTN